MRYHRTVIILILIVTATLLAGDLYAVTSSLRSFANVIRKLEVSRNGGKTWTTIFDNSTASVDLVAVSGQSVGNFIGSAIVPAGTYNRYKVTIDSVTLQFNVNDDLGGGQGILTINRAAMTVSWPIVREDTMSVKVSNNGTVNGVINFDAATSYTGLTYVLAGAPGSGTYNLTGLNFDPRVTVVSE